MGLALYEISERMKAIEAAADTETGELPPDLVEKLDGLNQALPEKVAGCCNLLANWKAEAEAYKAEKDRLAALEKAVNNRVEWMKNYLTVTLLTLGLNELVAGRWKLKFQKNSQPSCEVFGDAKNLPEQYQRVTVEPNKSAIVADWKEGKKLPPNVIVKEGAHLRVR